MTELKPCPFCRGNKIQLYVGNGGVCVRCADCGCRTMTRSDRVWDSVFYKGSAIDDVIEDWNRRTERSNE